MRNVLLELLGLDRWFMKKILYDENDEEMRKVFIKLLGGLDRWWIWRCLESSARCYNSKYDFITPPHLILHIFVNSSSSSWASSSFLSSSSPPPHNFTILLHLIVNLRIHVSSNNYPRQLFWTMRWTVHLVIFCSPAPIPSRHLMPPRPLPVFLVSRFCRDICFVS